MSLPTVLTPLLAQVLLTFCVLFYLGVVRSRAIKAGTMTQAHFEVRSRGAPPEAEKVANNFQNQFEIPVLFYVLVIVGAVTRAADLLFVVLAWLFVLSRVAHAYVHCTSNAVRLRAAMFAVGGIALLVMWAWITVRVVFGPGL